jgi:tetratricopeptide (TPR) repeat protein
LFNPVLSLPGGASFLGESAVARPAGQESAKESLEKLKARFEKNPSDVKLALLYGGRLVKDGRYLEAQPVFQKALALAEEPEDLAEIHFELGFIAFKEKKYDEALASWEIIRTRYKNTGRISHATINSGAVFYHIKGESRKAYDMLVDALNQALILKPHLDAAYKLLYLIHFGFEDYASAKKYLNKMSPEARRDEPIRNSLPVISWKLGDRAEAEKELAAYSAEIKDDYLALCRLAAVLAKSRVKLEAALRLAERANELSGGEVIFVLETYATLLFENGSAERAVFILEKAIGLAPEPDIRKALEEKLTRCRQSLKLPRSSPLPCFN